MKIATFRIDGLPEGTQYKPMKITGSDRSLEVCHLILEKKYIGCDVELMDLEEAY